MTSVRLHLPYCPAIAHLFGWYLLKSIKRPWIKVYFLLLCTGGASSPLCIPWNVFSVGYPSPTDSVQPTDTVNAEYWWVPKFCAGWDRLPFFFWQKLGSEQQFYCRDRGKLSGTNLTDNLSRTLWISGRRLCKRETGINPPNADFIVPTMVAISREKLSINVILAVTFKSFQIFCAKLVKSRKVAEWKSRACGNFWWDKLNPLNKGCGALCSRPNWNACKAHLCSKSPTQILSCVLRTSLYNLVLQARIIKSSGVR